MQFAFRLNILEFEILNSKNEINRTTITIQILYTLLYSKFERSKKMSKVIENKSGCKNCLDVINLKCVLCPEDDRKKKERCLLIINFS